MPEEMAYEAEPVMAAVVVHSMVGVSDDGTSGQAGETAPVVFDRQEASNSTVTHWRDKHFI